MERKKDMRDADGNLLIQQELPPLYRNVSVTNSNSTSKAEETPRWLQKARRQNRPSRVDYSLPTGDKD